MDKKEELIKQCRYYKGEKKNPYEGKEQNKSMLWFYEMMWVAEILRDNKSSMLSEYTSDYTSVGLAPFEKDDDTPLSYKALLFNRYARDSYSMIDAVEDFKKFYQKYYK